MSINQAEKTIVQGSASCALDDYDDFGVRYQTLISKIRHIYFLTTQLSIKTQSVRYDNSWGIQNLSKAVTETAIHLADDAVRLAIIAQIVMAKREKNKRKVL